MKRIDTFETLVIIEGKNGKYYIHPLIGYFEETIGPAFMNTAELTEYAIKHYSTSYV